MRAYKCDICGGLYEAYEYGYKQYWFHPSKSTSSKLEGTIDIHANDYILDICPDCRKAICDFINERVTDK